MSSRNTPVLCHVSFLLEVNVFVYLCVRFLAAMFQNGGRSPLEFSPPSRDFHKQSQNFFDMNIAELGGVSTGLTPVTHGRFLGDNPSLGTANSAAQNSFYSPQYGQNAPSSNVVESRTSLPTSWLLSILLGDSSCRRPIESCGGCGRCCLITLPPTMYNRNRITTCPAAALSPRLTAQQHRMRGQSMGQPYGFDLASLSHAAASRQRFHSSGGVGAGAAAGGPGMQMSAPGSGMNSPRGATSPQYPPAFATTAGSSNPFAVSTRVRVRERKEL